MRNSIIALTDRPGPAVSTAVPATVQSFLDGGRRVRGWQPANYFVGLWHAGCTSPL